MPGAGTTHVAPQVNGGFRCNLPCGMQESLCINANHRLTQRRPSEKRWKSGR
jgi:hypothetical protein